MVSSTTPRFGPRCPPVCDRTRISSSRTSCASCARSCSPSVLMSAGERMPSSNRFGFSGSAVVVVASKESDFIISQFLFGRFLIIRRFAHRFKIFADRLTRVIARDYLDLLFGTGEPFLANFHEVHSFLVAHDQILERQFPTFHLF